ncbi:Ribosomal RNA large subunit methyltransferase I [Linum perenne]
MCAFVLLISSQCRDPCCALNMENLLQSRIAEAVELRRRLGLPSHQTNAYRLVNSEGDRLSGLIVDVFGDMAVVASSAAWVEKYRQEVEACVSRIGEVNHINWRPSVEILKEEGLDAANFTDIQSSSCPQRTKVDFFFYEYKGEWLARARDFIDIVVENGISYAISLAGQKTGFYADQRESRHFISTISQGQKVVDICCYSGGFALNAARGGAINVTGVDSSLPALELARENVVLNNLDPERISFLKEDAAEFMKGAIARNESWDIVILDPPKLAPKRKDLRSASGMYRNLNTLAMRVVKRGGLLMTCSCSGAMTQSGTFLRVLQASLFFFNKFTGAALTAGRKITVVRQAGAASDHPVDPSYPEGVYLSNILLRVV